MQGDQFFVAFQQIGDGPLGDTYSLLDQALMDLRDRAMLSRLVTDRSP